MEIKKSRFWEGVENFSELLGFLKESIDLLICQIISLRGGLQFLHKKNN